MICCCSNIEIWYNDKHTSFYTGFRFPIFIKKWFENVSCKMELRVPSVIVLIIVIAWKTGGAAIDYLKRVILVMIGFVDQTQHVIITHIAKYMWSLVILFGCHWVSFAVHVAHWNCSYWCWCCITYKLSPRQGIRHAHTILPYRREVISSCHADTIVTILTHQPYWASCLLRCSHWPKSFGRGWKIRNPCFFDMLNVLKVCFLLRPIHDLYMNHLFSICEFMFF